MGGDGQSLLTFQELLSAVGGELIGGADKNAFCFSSVATDSRNVKGGTLFVPLIGEFQDGHKYIPDALKAGAAVVFLTKSVYEAQEKEYAELVAANPAKYFIVVKNNLYALQDAARAYVEKFPSLVKIGITGSSGKTTTKEILTSILKQKFNVIATQGNFNSETGLPLSVFNIQSEHQVGVFEMGMNRENEIGEISNVLKANYAIITNVGSAHIGILGSRQKIAEEKKKIFAHIKTGGAALIPNDSEFADFLAQGVQGKIVRFGASVVQNSGVEFIEDCGVDGTKFKVDGVETQLRIPGIHNFENALSCIALARALGVEPSKIAAGIESVKLPEGRSKVEKVKAKNGAEILLMADCYNANPESMQKALEFSATLKIAGKKIYVLGDMKELGEKAAEEHARIGTLVASFEPGAIIFVGSDMKAGAQAAKKRGYANAKYFSEKENYVEKVCEVLLSELKDGDFVLLKASHSMGFERIGRGIALQSPLTEFASQTSQEGLV